MGTEIERKFLVDHDKWHRVEKPQKQLIRQGYLVSDMKKTIRVRVTDTCGYITIKGSSQGLSRLEYEYEIPSDEAKQLLDNYAYSEINKIRYSIPFKGKTWEVDEFLGENEGLIVAEIELISESELFEMPEWITKEVSGEKKYYNSRLAITPYKDW